MGEVPQPRFEDQQSSDHISGEDMVQGHENIFDTNSDQTLDEITRILAELGHVTPGGRYHELSPGLLKAVRRFVHPTKETGQPIGRVAWDDAGEEQVAIGQEAITMQEHGIRRLASSLCDSLSNYLKSCSQEPSLTTKGMSLQNSYEEVKSTYLDICKQAGIGGFDRAPFGLRITELKGPILCLDEKGYLSQEELPDPFYFTGISIVQRKGPYPIVLELYDRDTSTVIFFMPSSGAKFEPVFENGEEGGGGEDGGGDDNGGGPDGGDRDPRNPIPNTDDLGQELAVPQTAPAR